jgi:hypothetical protein
VAETGNGGQRAEDAVALRVDEGLHEAARLGDRQRPQHGTHRQRGQAHLDVTATGLAFAQADTGERRVGEQTEGNESIARGPVAPGQVVTDDAKVVLGDVGELGAAGPLPQCPDISRSGLHFVVDLDVAASVHLDPSRFKSNPSRVGRASHRDQEVAPCNGLLAVWRAHEEAYRLARPTLHPEGLGPNRVTTDSVG